MDTDPIQRLAFHNGQRLDAGDFRLEQDYHVRVRRMLTQGLFTPGVVTGLEVSKASDTEVQVKPGIALDPLGREIILVTEQRVKLLGPGSNALNGYFLTVAYAEESVASGDPVCAPAATGAANRTEETASFGWTDVVPVPSNCTLDNPADCGIVLAFVAVSACTVTSVSLGPRQYALPQHVSQTQAFALEGEKDIDAKNPKVLCFQIPGGTPQSVTLYLWGDQFSSLYYTELGAHGHTLNTLADTGKEPRVTVALAHSHGLPEHTHDVVLSDGELKDVSGGSPSTESDGEHSHLMNIYDDATPIGDVIKSNATGRQPGYENYNAHGYYDNQQDGTTGRYLHPGPPYISGLFTAHKHALTQVRVSASTESGPSKPTLANTGSWGTTPDRNAIQGTTEPVGASMNARGGDAYTYLRDLHVAIDGHDITQPILDQLQWTAQGQTLGNGTVNHPINITSITPPGSGTKPGGGTGPIDLLRAAEGQQVALDQGSHFLEFSVADGGGKLMYNLYIA